MIDELFYFYMGITSNGVEQSYALGFGKFADAPKNGFFLLSTNKASLGFSIEAPQYERHIKLLLILLFW